MTHGDQSPRRPDRRPSDRAEGPGRARALLRRSPLAATVVVVTVALVAIAARSFLKRSVIDEELTARVERGDLVVRLTETGVLRPARSITYRSPLTGRTAEIVHLTPEGTRVGEGDLLVRLDTSELQLELERAVQARREAGLDLQVAEIDRQAAAAALESLTEGAGALAVDEARTRLELTEKRVERLREDYESLKPLLERGYITREELDRAAFELEQAETEFDLARRKTGVLVDRTHPADVQRARLELAQRESRLESARARAVEADRRLAALGEAIEACSIHARNPGLVVYETHVGATPRRKVRVGDRVTPSQGIVTIPEVARMVVESAVDEADVHRVRAGQPVTIRLDAFPDLSLTGKVSRVGALARQPAGRRSEIKRFDLVVAVDPAEAELRPEMTARLDILVSRHEDVLLVPVGAVFERDGAFRCHVLRRGRIETREVTLGPSDGLRVEVVAGLRQGERVLLADVPSGRDAPRDGNPGDDSPAS